MKRGLCSIAGDIIHHGHLEFIEQCSKRCDFLIVAIMSDEAIEKYKGRKPIMSFMERVRVIEHTKFLNRIVNQYEFRFKGILELCAPDILFDSIEHKGQREKADVYLPRTEGISSTIIKERVIEEYLNNSKRKKKWGVKRK